VAATTISFQRANNLFLVSSASALEPRRVTEQQLRAIGDMDINNAVETAMMNPYDQVAIRACPVSKKRRWFS
jgi:hypothetical protein